MSGRTWLRIEGALPAHPKVITFASYYGVHPYLVCGFLVAWWAYCTEYASRGRPADVSADTLNALALPLLQQSDKAIVPTIRDGLIRSGLMDDDGAPHDWEEYTGTLLTKRAKDAQRKRLARELAKKEKGDVSSGHPTDGARTSQPKSRVEYKQNDIAITHRKSSPERLTPDQVRVAAASAWGKSA